MGNDAKAPQGSRGKPPCLMNIRKKKAPDSSYHICVVANVSMDSWGNGPFLGLLGYIIQLVEYLVRLGQHPWNCKTGLQGVQVARPASSAPAHPARAATMGWCADQMSAYRDLTTTHHHTPKPRG